MDPHLIVLHQLSRHNEPISLPQLLAQLGPPYTERSIRRWLVALVSQGLVARTGHKRGTKYAVIHRANRPSTGTCFSAASLESVALVQRPLYDRPLATYNDTWLESYEPNRTTYCPLPMRAQLHQAGHRTHNHDPAGTYAHVIFDRLLIDLSYNSSRLEGNTYSLLDTQRLLFQGTPAEGKPTEEATMILNHKEAIRYLVDRASTLLIQPSTIQTIHYLLADGLVEYELAGHLRTHGVRITGSTYLPLEHASQLRPRLELIADKGARIEDPYEQSLFLLAHLSYLQAFTDVNKRTARLSANIPLVKNNLVPLSFNDIARDDYMTAMIAIYEENDMRPLLDLYLFSYMRTCALYDATVHQIGFDEVRARYRQQRRALIRDVVLHQLTGPALRDYLAMQSLTIAGPTESAALLEDALEDLKALDEIRITGLGITIDDLKAWQRVQ